MRRAAAVGLAVLVIECVAARAVTRDCCAYRVSAKRRWSLGRRPRLGRRLCTCPPAAPFGRPNALHAVRHASPGLHTLTPTATHRRQVMRGVVSADCRMAFATALSVFLLMC